jgi:hypothetical protein
MLLAGPTLMSTPRLRQHSREHTGRGTASVSCDRPFLANPKNHACQRPAPQYLSLIFERLDQIVLSRESQAREHVAAIAPRRIRYRLRSQGYGTVRRLREAFLRRQYRHGRIVEGLGKRPIRNSTTGSTNRCVSLVSRARRQFRLSPSTGSVRRIWLMALRNAHPYVLAENVTFG